MISYLENEKKYAIKDNSNSYSFSIEGEKKIKINCFAYKRIGYDVLVDVISYLHTKIGPISHIYALLASMLISSIC